MIKDSAGIPNPLCRFQAMAIVSPPVIEHFVNAVWAADVRNEILDCEIPLLHHELDGFDRVGRSSGICRASYASIKVIRTSSLSPSGVLRFADINGSIALSAAS